VLCESPEEKRLRSYKGGAMSYDSTELFLKDGALAPPV